MKSKKGYFVRMKKRYCFILGDSLKPWVWEIITYNGHCVSICPEPYKNRTNCRTVAKRFADAAGFEFREETK